MRLTMIQREWLVRLGLRNYPSHLPGRTAAGLERRGLVVAAARDDDGYDLFRLTANGREWLELWREGKRSMGPVEKELQPAGAAGRTRRP